MVWAWDEATGESDCRPIAETFARGTEMLLALDIVDDGGQVEQITTTAENPFYRPELGRFVRADELAVGDAVLSTSGAWLKVGSATWIQQSATVYNLTVDEFHTYFVGQAGTLVHNQDCSRKNNLDVLSENAGKLDLAGKGGVLTKAERALQKHGQRGSEHFPRVSGSPADINRQGQAIVDDILTSPGATFTTEFRGRYENTINVRDRSGRGVRFQVQSR